MRHFTFAELISSDTAQRLDIDNMPKDINLIDNLDRLIAEVLEPLRVAYGRPIFVNSGYRCRQLNTAVGGVATSHHLQGRAADIVGSSAKGTRLTGTALRIENRKLYDLIVQLKLPIKELIAEQAETDAAARPLWVHVAV